ncbi:DUF1822 family protein [Scytonema hofmannii FACHB-248]|uniref:DUF1822 family protein n=1 Tax=Scytonema hofmannii FACHB-248 TaxID=1842502 RepID=A0ABR8GKS7_9CYAN|nr:MULTISPECIES: DUF1822 family protein [Nostocales]MBD2603796.1 DUF1822 family protein [Scytonema hofmannii FACHB-248]
MMNQPLATSDLPDLPDWQSLNETRIELLPKHFQKAARLSQSIHLPEQRWQVYLCALGVLGFEQWLQERAPDLQLQSDRASIWQPAYANLFAAACNIQIGDFKVCLLTSNNLTNQHSVPFAVLDIPDFAAHFYVLMQVEEEEQQVAVSGFMNYNQYLHYQQTERLQVDADWTYTIPETWFDSNPDALLLNLRCLDADAIQLPAKTTRQIDTNTALRQKLTTLTSQLQKQPFSRLLTVKEGTSLLNNPDLIHYSYKILSPSLAQPLINVGFWLRNQIDAVASELGWMLMPFPALSELRTLQDEFDQIRSGLEQNSIHIPSAARGAYRDLECDRGSLRLYAIMWVLSETTENREWVLLIALGSQPQRQMPKTLKLEVRDETQLLFAESLEDTSKNILYAQVIGNWDERFWVTVTVDNETVFEIPPFGMELQAT